MREHSKEQIEKDAEYVRAVIKIVSDAELLYTYDEGHPSHKTGERTRTFPPIDGLNIKFVWAWVAGKAGVFTVHVGSADQPDSYQKILNTNAEPWQTLACLNGDIKRKETLRSEKRIERILGKHIPCYKLPTTNQ
tara:strand:- start:4878 stop:5282 length:405 start_codon:yes stop_codon:yes gene_type:complete